MSAATPTNQVNLVVATPCFGGQISVLYAMADHRPRSSYESDWLPYTKVSGRSAVRAAIGEALKRRSEVLQPVPHEMLTLAMQVNALHEDVER